MRMQTWAVCLLTNAAGEIKPAGPARGKISCIDQRVTIPGFSLPIH